MAAIDDEFPNDDFFPDIDDLFDDMTNDASASASAGPYVIYHLLPLLLVRMSFIISTRVSVWSTTSCNQYKYDVFSL